MMCLCPCVKSAYDVCVNGRARARTVESARGLLSNLEVYLLTARAAKTAKSRWRYGSLALSAACHFGRRVDQSRTSRLQRFVCCLTSQQHASVSQERICIDNRTCCHTEKMQLKLSTSHSHSVLTPGRPVPSLTLYNARRLAG